MILKGTVGIRILQLARTNGTNRWFYVVEGAPSSMHVHELALRRCLPTTRDVGRAFINSDGSPARSVSAGWSHAFIATSDGRGRANST